MRGTPPLSPGGSWQSRASSSRRVAKTQHANRGTPRGWPFMHCMATAVTCFLIWKQEITLPMASSSNAKKPWKHDWLPPSHICWGMSRGRLLEVTQLAFWFHKGKLAGLRPLRGLWGDWLWLVLGLSSGCRLKWGGRIVSGVSCSFQHLKSPGMTPC